MIVQACLNGVRDAGYHPALPQHIDDVVHSAIACIRAGAAELHVHPRGDDTRESLAAVDQTVRALRRACPGTLLGISTGAWIEGDVHRTRERIANWVDLPDYASVNFSEPDAPAVMSLLIERGIGVEAGLASDADALRFIGHPACQQCLRVLIEIEQQDPVDANQVADDIIARLDSAGLYRPRLLHGIDATIWQFVERAAQSGYSTRIGLEDGRHLPDGSLAKDNEELVSAAMRYRRSAV